MSKVKVLFLCTGNSCRSQMAEGWCRHLKSDIIEAFSVLAKEKNIDRTNLSTIIEDIFMTLIYKKYPPRPRQNISK